MSQEDKEEQFVIPDDGANTIEVFRLISGQLIMARLESPLRDMMTMDSFIAYDPVEITHQPMYNEMGELEESETLLSDFLSEFNDQSITLKTSHIMVYSKVDVFKYLQEQYIDFLEYLYDKRQFIKEAEEMIEKNGGTGVEVFSETNRELYQEILESIENEENGTLH